MPALSIIGSPDVLSLDSNITASICEGEFKVDVIPSVYSDGGNQNVEGAKVKIISPLGIEVKSYGAGYDIVPPMEDVVSVAIPTQGGKYQYGTYKVLIQLTDSQGNVYETVEKPVKLCPIPNSEGKKYGVIGGKIKAVCKQGLVNILLNLPPVYNGRVSDKQTTDLTLKYPTDSEKEPDAIGVSNFAATLFEGVYSLKGEVCASYFFGDRVRVDVPFKVSIEKNVKCSIDECCLFDKLKEINAQLNDNCSPETRAQLSNIVLDVIYNIKDDI